MSASTVIARYGGLKRTYDQTRDPDPAGHSSSSSPTGFSATTPKPLQRRLSASSSILGDEKLRTLPRTASFDSAASVVLIGLRGVGKSTLGVLAATAYGRRLVEADHGFFEATGSTPTIYRRTHGTAAYQKRHFQTLERTLQDHDQGAVIICSFSDLENNGAALLRHYAQTHPVIHILREADAVRSHLHVSREGKIEELLSASTPLLRSCSNYEFYNLSEKSNTDNDSRHRPSSDIEKQISGSAKADFLALKSVERDFIRLLRNIVGDGHRGPSHHSAYPFSNIKVEDRSYTTSVTVSVSELVTNSLDLDAAQIGADCVELTVDSHDTELTEQLNNTSKAFAILRRSSILPIMLAAKNSQELTQFCLRLGPDFCALELSYSDTHLQRLIACRGVSRVIGTLHITERPDRGWNDETCLQIYTRAAGLGCALVRISMPARSADLDYSIFSFKEAIEALQLPTRLIAFETGAAGRTSKCFNQVLTPVNPVAGSKTELNDVVSSKELTEALFATFVLQPMHFFIYGAQVDYSLSPTMHNSAFAACGMPHTYTAYSRDDLDEFKSLASSTRFGGAAVTQPFKTAILSYMHGLSSHAKIIGAVNTVIPIRGLHNDGALPLETTLVNDCNRQGPVTALYGHNTGKFRNNSFNNAALLTKNAQTGSAFVAVCARACHRRTLFDPKVPRLYAAPEE